MNRKIYLGIVASIFKNYGTTENIDLQRLHTASTNSLTGCQYSPLFFNIRGFIKEVEVEFLRATDETFL